MTQPDPSSQNGFIEPLQFENDTLRQELTQAQTELRSLRRELKKAHELKAEATRAHAKMVTTLTETMRENAALSIELDAWKTRLQREEQEHEEYIASVEALLGIESITEAEAGAIRKAMARLHHPDSGGNTERMKTWNAILDKIERREG